MCIRDRYALEGFLERLSRSRHRDRFVLKGGVLLAAFDERRPTRDVDLAGLQLDNAIETVTAVSYTHLRAHETVLDLVCRLLLEKKNLTDTHLNQPILHNTITIDTYYICRLPAIAVITHSIR